MNQQTPYSHYSSQPLSYPYTSTHPYNQHPGGFQQYPARSTHQPPATRPSSQQQQQAAQSHVAGRTSSLQSSHSLQQRILQQSPQPLVPQHQQQQQTSTHASSSQQQTQQPSQPQSQSQLQHHQSQQPQQHNQQYIRPFLPPTPRTTTRTQLQPARASQTPNPRNNTRQLINRTQDETSSSSPTLPATSRLSLPIDGPAQSTSLDGRLLNALHDSTDHSAPSANLNGTHSSVVNLDDDPDDDADDPVDANEPVFNIPPPPQCNYPSEAELEKAIHAWSLLHGYELVRRASKKNAAGALYKRYYHCSKHGKIANTGKLTDKTRVRTNRKSNRMGCPMSVAAVAVDPANPAGEWQIRHRKIHHNHGPLEAVSMAGHRRRARMGGVEKAVDGLFAIGTSTAQILQFLQRTNPSGLFTRTDVANMKLKYKKFGTCVKDEESGRSITGVPSACLTCRAKKQKCDSGRPICGSCIAANLECEYDHEPNPLAQSREPTPRNSSPVQDTESNLNTTQLPIPANASTGSHNAAQQILADLQSFQTEHVRPSKLSLQSSSVEILAQSSCGNGDSYKSLPMLNVASEWTVYHDSMMESTLKENTYDVLTGSKPEPNKPGDDCSVEEWNEYIKQLAIFMRRNSALLGAIWGTLGAGFRTRVTGMRSAHAVWQALEETCLPRGSDQAFRLYVELTNITLQNSQNLRDYIARLENAHAHLVRLKTSSYVNGRPSSNPMILQSARAGSSIFPEDQLCLFFMRNLGMDWRRWVDSLCASNNVAGFGTGPKLSFHDVSRRAIEFEALQTRSSYSR